MSFGELRSIYSTGQAAKAATHHPATEDVIFFEGLLQQEIEFRARLLAPIPCYVRESS